MMPLLVSDIINNLIYLCWVNKKNTIAVLPVQFFATGCIKHEHGRGSLLPAQGCILNLCIYLRGIQKLCVVCFRLLQHTGLNDCQARSENKLHFHFNSALTGINIAKVEHWLSLSKVERGAFSMNDIKTINNNMLQLQRFFDKFGINPHSTKNQLKAKELIYYGTIAA